MDKDQNQLMKIGITCGDPAGIGPELIVKMFADNRLLQETTVVAYCPISLINKWKKQLNLEDLPVQTIQNISQAQVGKLNVVSPKENIDITEGSPTVSSAKIALWALERSSEDLVSDALSGVVTAPVSKQNMHTVAPGFTGHTEFYNERFKADGALMVLCEDRLKVALATNHIAIKDIPAAVVKDTVVSAIKTLDLMLRQDFNIIKPKIAILGLNPHAGESGTIGLEEMEQISPAISNAKNAGILAFGPYSADGFFGAGSCFEFDAVLAMYHDQGLTGFKAIAFDGGVNYTAGLTITRTSPGHGTAFELAGKGEASVEGMRNALYLAMDVARNRQDFKLNNSNPLGYTAGHKEYEGMA
ncbi:MAG: 4-hydroxythreonine-4-phosphate dehydrogenase PdxA [Flavobacteriales bacterium]